MLVGNVQGSKKTAKMTKLRAFLQTLQQHREQKSTRVIYPLEYISKLVKFPQISQWINSTDILKKCYNFSTSTRRNDNVITTSKRRRRRRRFKWTDPSRIISCTYFHWEHGGWVRVDSQNYHEWWTFLIACIFVVGTSYYFMT